MQAWYLQMIRQNSVLLVIKLGALLSACGGPLMVMDATKPSLGPALSFAAGFAPVAIALLGSFSLREDDPWNWGKWAVWCGFAGIAVVAVMNVFAISQLVGGYALADRGLIIFGIAVGCASSIVYAALAWRRLRTG